MFERTLVFSPGASRGRSRDCSAPGACNPSCGWWCAWRPWPQPGPSICAAGPGNLTPSNIDPVLALIWAIGAACALGAAWQAKFHRLAALILLGGTGLVVCVTFVWFSHPTSP